MSYVVIGIDPGKDGALVALDQQGKTVMSYLSKRDFTIQVGKGSKRKYTETRMAQAIEYISTQYKVLLVAIEKQWARPKQGVSSTFSSGLGYGLWRGILASKGVRYMEVSPKTWAKEVLRDVGGDGKGRSVYVASQRVPDLDLTPGLKRKPHDGLADAACIALYGLSTLPKILPIAETGEA